MSVIIIRNVNNCMPVDMAEDLNLQHFFLSMFMFSEFMVEAMQFNQISRKSVESGFTLQGF